MEIALEIAVTSLKNVPFRNVPAQAGSFGFRRSVKINRRGAAGGFLGPGGRLQTGSP